MKLCVASTIIVVKKLTIWTRAKEKFELEKTNFNTLPAKERGTLPPNIISVALIFPSLLGLSTSYKNSSLRQAGFAPQSGSGLDFVSNSYQYLTRPIIEILRMLHADFSIYSQD